MAAQPSSFPVADGSGTPELEGGLGDAPVLATHPHGGETEPAEGKAAVLGPGECAVDAGRAQSSAASETEKHISDPRRGSAVTAETSTTASLTAAESQALRVCENGKRRIWTCVLCPVNKMFPKPTVCPVLPQARGSCGPEQATSCLPERPPGGRPGGENVLVTCVRVSHVRRRCLESFLRKQPRTKMGASHRDLSYEAAQGSRPEGSRRAVQAFPSVGRR